jgi:hypothetical protein
MVVSDPISVDRRVSPSGLICVATQRIHVCKLHAGKTVTVYVPPDLLHIDIEPGLTVDLCHSVREGVVRRLATVRRGARQGLTPTWPRRATPK